MSIHSEPNLTLAAAAFGDRPDLHPLPPANSPFEQWLRAVALAGQGCYTEAADHARSLRDPPHPTVLRSMALSLEASILRQQGDHDQAMRLDLRALSLLPERGPEFALARCDALTGLAADHIGLGQLDRTHEALSQVPALFDMAELGPFGWRARIRWEWVSAETAMAAGDQDGALLAALTGRELAQKAPSLRHRIKSHLLFAAAQICRENGTSARFDAQQVFAEAEAAGLTPLAWAAAMLVHAAAPDLGWDERAAQIRRRWT